MKTFYLIKCHFMKMYWGREVQFQAFLTSALNRGELSASSIGRFTPRERDYASIGHEDMWAPELAWIPWRIEEIGSLPYQESKPNSPSHGFVTTLTELPNSIV
jgi:hypothetical protein